MGAMEEPQEIEFERLSEFFFDLCLSWCQHLDIETFLFFLNGIFLNITKGAHVNVSVFKPLEEIDVLSIEFFNTLLNLRAVCEKRLIEKEETYKDWYSRNFGRQGDLIRRVEKELQEAFKERGEERILDIWIDMPTGSDNSYINQHFDKLDKELRTINKALNATEMLAQSITLMEQLKKFNNGDKNMTYLSKRDITMRMEQEQWKDEF